MPLQWTISHPSRLVIAVARDEVSPDDLCRYLEAISAEGALSYRKMFDVTHATGRFDDDSVRRFGALVHKQAEKAALGPLAIIARSDEAFRLAVVYAEAAVASRPVRIFCELHKARRWLDSFAESSSVEGSGIEAPSHARPRDGASSVVALR